MPTSDFPDPKCGCPRVQRGLHFETQHEEPCPRAWTPPPEPPHLGAAWLNMAEVPTFNVWNGHEWELCANEEAMKIRSAVLVERAACANYIAGLAFVLAENEKSTVGRSAFLEWAEAIRARP